jgi:hypothetical protein
MDISTYNYIHDMISTHTVFQTPRGKTPQKPVGLQLQVFLLYLCSSGHGGSHHSIAAHFGIGDGSVRLFCRRVQTALLSHRDDVIKWPQGSDRDACSAYIEEVSGFRNCLGFVDGTTFKLLRKPLVNGECYFSRKSVYSINSQVVCDRRRYITYLSVGYPGSVHDARSLRCSGINTHQTEYFSEDQYLLGDSAYGTAFPYVISPFKSPVSKQERNKYFNYLLSKSRIIAEHCIGILKSRFPRLRDGFTEAIQDERDNEYVCKSIVAAAVLHNICIIRKDNEDWLDCLDVSMDEDESYAWETVTNADGLQVTSEEKRTEQMSRLLVSWGTID